MSPFELHIRKRDQYYVDARRVFMLVAREAGYKTTQIGRYLGLDHSTVCWHTTGKACGLTPRQANALENVRELCGIESSGSSES